MVAETEYKRVPQTTPYSAPAVVASPAARPAVVEIVIEVLVPVRRGKRNRKEWYSQHKIQRMRRRSKYGNRQITHSA